MKHRIAYSLTAAVTAAVMLLSTACSEHDDAVRPSVSGSQRMSLSASVGQVKSGFTRGTLDNTFDGTELLAITMRDAETAAAWPVVRRYVASTSGRLTHSGDLMNNPEDVDPWVWPEDADSISLMGWHCADYYRTVINNEEFGVPEDQTTRAKMQAHDFLYSPEATFTDADAESLTMNFWHQLSLVRVYIESDDEIYDDASTVRMFGTQWAQSSFYTQPLGDDTKLYGAWGTYGGVFTGHTAFSNQVQPLLVSHSNNNKMLLFAALALPQQTRGRQLISIDHGGEHFTYTLPDDEAESPDYLPGLVYTYHLKLKEKLVLVTPEPWEEDEVDDRGTSITCTIYPWDPIDPDDYGMHVDANPWLGIDLTATYVSVLPWLKSDHPDNTVTPDPWLPVEPGGIDFWIVDWLREDTTGVIDYVTLRRATDTDTIPVQLTDTLKYQGDFYYYSGGFSTTWGLSALNVSQTADDNATRTEGYVEWSVLTYSRNKPSLYMENSGNYDKNPWAFRVDDNSKLQGKTVNVLRLRTSGAATKTIRVFKKKRNTAFDLSEEPAATATFTSVNNNEEVTFRLSTALTLAAGEYLVFDIPANTFCYDDNYKEGFYCHANTSNWATMGASLGIDVGYVEPPLVDSEGVWYITSCTDNTANLTDSRVAMIDSVNTAHPRINYGYDNKYFGYSYPMTMQVRLRGYAFNALRFLRYKHGSFDVWAYKWNGDRRKLGTVTVSADDEDPADQTKDKLLVTRRLKDEYGNDVTATLADNELIVIGAGISNWYSKTGGHYDDYGTYTYGPEGNYLMLKTTQPYRDDLGIYWSGYQDELMGVDVGFVDN